MPFIVVVVVVEGAGYMMDTTWLKHNYWQLVNTNLLKTKAIFFLHVRSKALYGKGIIACMMVWLLSKLRLFMWVNDDCPKAQRYGDKTLFFLCNFSVICQHLWTAVGACQGHAYSGHDGSWVTNHRLTNRLWNTMYLDSHLTTTWQLLDNLLTIPNITDHWLRHIRNQFFSFLDHMQASGPQFSNHSA